MNNISVFRIEGQKTTRLPTKKGHKEGWLQKLVEQNLEPLLGVRFLASEFATTKAQAGRIDTLGLDENGFPVIIEYKRTMNENIVTQGLFYLDWLLDHKAEFHQVVGKRLGKQIADEVDWSAPRLICIAEGYTRFDEHAVKQIERNIDLLRYQLFSSDLIVFEQLYSAGSSPTPKNSEKGKAKTGDKPIAQWLKDLNPVMKSLYDSLRAYILELGDDVVEKETKLYMSYRRVRSFACIIVNKSALTVTAKLNPDEFTMEKGFTRDVRRIGHWGTGDFEIVIRSTSDLEKAKPLIAQAYENA